jgi:preprotein translocase subunit SecD
MGQRTFFTRLAIILVLLGLVIYIDWPNNHSFFGIRSTDTKLGLDLRGGLQVLLQADVAPGVQVTDQQMKDAMQILENRANALGVGEVVFQQAGAQRILAEFPGLTDTEQAISLMKETGLLAFVPMDNNPLNPGTVINVDISGLTASASGTTTPGAVSATPADTATPVTPSDTPTVEATPTQEAAAGSTPSAETPQPTATATEIPTYQAIMTGEDLQSVSVGQDNLGAYYIAFTLTAHGSQVFSDFTSSHVNQYLGIVLDNTVISSPVISTAITGGSGEISGNFTKESANNLAIQLRYGSLPVPIAVVESRQIGATLGQDSINKSILAGAIGLAMVILFMIAMYRLPGVVASLALAVYSLTTFALYKMIPVTLSLPGIAGFVLSIGVAVDANILIFERLKEELRGGRTLAHAIDLGWNRAWPSIRDSNITTLISCTILFWFGSAFGASLVKGFALTLAIGVGVSLFTAVFVTRVFLHAVLDNLKFTEHPRWFGV